MVFKDKTNGKLSYILYNNYIKIDGREMNNMEKLQQFIKIKIKEGYKITYSWKNKNVEIEISKLFVTYKLSLNNYNDKYVIVTKYLDLTKEKSFVLSK